MRRLARRQVLRILSRLPIALAGVAMPAACGPRVIEVERIIEREVTKVVTEVVRETVLVQRSPEIIEKTIEVEKVVTVTPAPPSVATIVAHGMTYGWTQFAAQMAPAFEEMFPQITIEWASRSDWSRYPEHIAALQASGEIGDLLECLPGVLLQAWAGQGLLQPLDALIVDDAFDTSGIFPSALNVCQCRGQLFALPIIAQPGAALLLYHRDAFDRAGLEHPRQDWTLTDLSAAARRLTADDNGDGFSDRFGYALAYGGSSVPPLLGLFGAHLFSEDGRRCVIDSPEGLDCLGWAHERIQRDHSVPTPTEVMQGPLSLFESGRAAMVRQTLLGLRNLLRLPEGGSGIGAVLFPQHPQTGARAAVSSGIAYAISSQSDRVQQALQWIKFVSSREMGAQMFLSGHSYPGSRFASWTDPRVLEVEPLCAQVADLMAEAHVLRLPHNLRLGECLGVWDDALAPMLHGEDEPAAVAAAMARAIDQVLALPAHDLFQAVQRT